MNKLQKKIRAVEEDHAEEVLTEHLDKHAMSKRDRALFILGNIRATDRIAKALGSQAMIAAFAFQKENLHADLGYPAFAEFLDESEFSPMSKHEFYERKKIFENEGVNLFDALNELEVPLKTRKLLGKGNIQLDGETVVLIDPATSEEIRFELKDKTRILETITALADSSADLRKKVESQKTKLDSADNLILNLSEEVERVKVSKIAASENPHSSALMNLVAAFGLMTLEAESLSAIEKEQFATRTFETIAALMNRLSKDGYNRKDWAKELSKPGKSKPDNVAEKDDDDFLIESVLNDENEDDNDSELAQLM